MLPPKFRGKCFKIGGAPWIEVSWQITGVRQHRSAQANPLVVTAKEPKRARLLYLSRALRLAWGTRVFDGIAPHSSCLSFARHKKSRWLREPFRARVSTKADLLLPLVSDRRKRTID